MIKGIERAEYALKAVLRRRLRNYRRTKYLRSGRRAWSYGYGEYKDAFITAALHDHSLLRRLREREPLPAGYGIGIDERAVEIPWALSHLREGGVGHLLDAGSALNHEFVLAAPPIATSRVTIITLAPEAAAHWERGISYVFGDLRELDFKSDCFDAITCISTIEHVGMDNFMYVRRTTAALSSAPGDYTTAVREMARVLKPGGVLLMTFPFGRRANYGWLQQFDAMRADLIIEAFQPAAVRETIFRYHADGWRLSDRLDSADCEYSSAGLSAARGEASSVPDNAAAARAVACLELRK